MAKVIGKEQLCSTDLKYFKALQGRGGSTLFDRYPSLDNIIKNNIDAKYQDFLAHPAKEGNTITFYGRTYGEAPRILSDLEESEREKYEHIKAETLTHFNSKIDSLKSSDKTTEATFLADAIKFIDDRFMYCYDGKVVLGVWGMQLRENVREDISEIRKNLTFKTKTPTAEPESQPELPVEEPAIESTEDSKEPEHIVDEPPIVPPVPPERLPWYQRFWNWLQTLLTGRGCLRWLLWLLLLLLLLWLLSWLFRSCEGSRDVGGAALSGNDSTWLHTDPNVGNNGGIHDPSHPYQPKPTPPGYDDVLPPQQGVLPPIEEDPEIIPGNPTILGNRLNILMENDDKSILDLAKDFKAKYPDDKYNVVYYDDVVKRMQIEVPKEERERLKEEIPAAFAPEYELFVFDEALFEGSTILDDSVLSDSDRSWYLNAIKAPQAWKIIRGSEKITVAIVDNGFNLKHPELAAKVVAPYHVWKHSNKVFPQQIDHGTHVAGIALAIAPHCKFMPVQVADEQGLMTTTSVLDGILYSLYQGADVVNVSLGSQFTGLSQFSDNEQQNLIRNHFKEEERLWRRIMRIAANHNSTIVVAAGNDNVLAGIDAIQRPELFITVSAVDKNNQNFNKAQFSNYGSYSTISAPGVGIYSSIGGNGYATMDGTSMAAPIVAGAVALMKSLSDSITTKQIICILQSTGIETQGNIGKLIQLDKALQKVKSGETVDCTPSPSAGDVQILLSWDNYNDLDLICTDPYGESIFFESPMVSSGGQLEIDMNVEYPDSKTPIENIYWRPGSAPDGTYNVYLLYYKRHEANIDETPYHVKVIYRGTTEDYTGVIRKGDDAIHICSFTLGTVGNNPRDPNISPINDKRSQLEQERDRLQQELDRVNKELRRIGSAR